MSIRPDGLHFGLSFDDYLAEPRFSGHGALKIIQSTLDFWASSWMNPNRNEGDDDSEFKRKGTAYHKRIIEGKDAFEAAYYIMPQKSDYEDLLVTVDDIKTHLDAAGVVYGSKINKAGLVMLAQQSGANVWDSIVAEAEEEADGREIIPAKWAHDIELSAANIERHPQLKDVFKNGMPEVSVFWHEVIDIDGVVREVPMKSRFDYLKPKLIPDLKSFSNIREQSLDRALYSVMASRKYHVTTAIYYTASDRASEFIESDKIFLHGVPRPNKGWLDAVAKHKEDRQFLFVFQKSGPAPVALGRFLRRQTGAVDTGRITFLDAMEKFVRAQDTYGTDPWVVIDDIKDFEDQEFPAYTWG